MSRAILDRGNGKGWDATWTGGAWELVDFLKKQVGDEWLEYTILHSDMPKAEVWAFEAVCKAVVRQREAPPSEPVVEQLPAEREWHPRPPQTAMQRTEAAIPYGTHLTADSTWAPDVAHNYVTGIGDCFDWLDHDTKMLVREAVELNDTDDLEEFSDAARWFGAPSTRSRVAASVKNRSKRVNEILAV
jgi:hypothetical protein